MLDVLRSLLALGSIGLSAFGLGRPLLRRLRIAQDDPLGVAVWSLSLGLLLGGSVFMLLARAGWLYAVEIGALSLVAGLWALVELACVHLGYVHGRILAVAAGPDPAEPPRPCPVGARWALVLAGLTLLASFVVALAPPTSPEALSQGLKVSQTVLFDHGFAAAREDSESAPNIVHMWFLWALALDGPVTATLVHWFLGVLAALATVLLARPILGGLPAVLAGCLVLLCPGVSYQMGAPLEDLALGLFTTLALVAVWQVVVQLESDGWAVVAGLMLGGAVAAKPAGAGFALAIALAWLYAFWTRRDSRDELARAASRLAVAAMLAAGPWVLAASIGREIGPSQPLASVVVHLGPLALVTLGGLLLARRLRGLQMLLGVMGAYLAIALAIPLPGRWWSPLVPLLAVATVWVWEELDRLPRPARLAVAFAGGILLFAGPLVCGRRAATSVAVATGWQSRDRYLLAHEPTYRSASVMNRIAQLGDRLFCQDPRTLYFACPTKKDSCLQHGLPAGSAVPSAEGVLDRARSEGCSYVLLAEPVEVASSQAQPAARRTPEGPPQGAAEDETRWIGKVIPILEYRFADDNNRSIRYRLLRLR